MLLTEDKLCIVKNLRHIDFKQSYLYICIGCREEEDITNYPNVA